MHAEKVAGSHPAPVAQISKRSTRSFPRVLVVSAPGRRRDDAIRLGLDPEAATSARLKRPPPAVPPAPPAGAPARALRSLASQEPGHTRQSTSARLMSRLSRKCATNRGCYTSPELMRHTEEPR